MIYEEMTDLAAALPRVGALAGRDLGTKTIGVAVSDGLRQVASPITVLRRQKFTLDAAALLAIIRARGLAGLILGLPRNMDGSEGPRAQSTRAFARNLARLTDLPIGYWDERLSTVAAERALLEADTSRKRRAPWPKASMISLMSASVAAVGSRVEMKFSTGEGASGVTAGSRLWLPACPSSPKMVPPASWTRSVNCL